MFLKIHGLLSAIVLVCCSFSAYSAPLPVKAYAGLPDVNVPTLSPDGNKIASLISVDLPDKKGTAISVLTIDTGKTDYVLFTDNSKYTLHDLTWANDELLLVDAKYPFSRQGTPVTEWRLVKIDVNTKKMRSVIPDSYLKRLRYIPNIQNNVIDYMPDDEQFLLMSLAGFGSGGEPSVVKISLDGSGKTSVVQPYKKDYIEWLTDVQHNVRIGVHSNDAQYTVMARASEDDDFRELWTWSAFDGEHVWPMGFGIDPAILYVKALHEGRDAVFKVNLTDPTLSKELVYYNDQYDITGGLRRSNETGEVIGVGNTFFDKKYAGLKKSIDKALPGTKNYFMGFSRDGNSYSLLSTSDNEPGVYLLGNKKQKSLAAFAYKYQQLTPDVLSKKQDISYDARDGLKIEGYLTLPKGVEGKNLPTIIFPHGGPISFEGAGFDYWSQFLASRGYAVLQMDFRGSSGYGYDFMKQGIASWGQAMQDDVEDGTRWLIKQGIANPEKICILGASYGGYAALMGTVKAPDLYQCAVSFAGVTDVEYLVKSYRNFTNYEVVKKQIGDDNDLLWDASPLKHASKINVPVLLMHGDKDRSVRVQHSEDMYDELKNQNKSVSYIELEGGDHYLSNTEHRIEVFTAMEQFLAEHLL